MSNDPFFSPDVYDILEDTRGELDDAHKRLDKLETMLLDLRDWFDERSDGCQIGEDFVPNIEMVLAGRIDEVLA
jgi:hypothetical protein